MAVPGGHYFLFDIFKIPDTLYIETLKNGGFMYINKLFLTLIMATFATNLFAMESNNNNNQPGKEEAMEIVEFENVLTLEAMPDEILEQIIIFAIDEKDFEQIDKNLLPIAKVCRNFRQLLNGSGVKTFLVKKAFADNKDLFEIFGKLGFKSLIMVEPKSFIKNTSMQSLKELLKEINKFDLADEESVTSQFLANFNQNTDKIKDLKLFLDGMKDDLPSEDDFLTPMKIRLKQFAAEEKSKWLTYGQYGQREREILLERGADINYDNTLSEQLRNFHHISSKLFKKIPAVICNSCNQEISKEEPAKHFQCGHSTHQSCVELQSPSQNNYCPKCYDKLFFDDID